MRSAVFLIQAKVLRANQELSSSGIASLAFQGEVYHGPAQLGEICVDVEKIVRQSQFDLNHFRKRPDKDVLH